MTDERNQESQGLLDALLSPLRAPQRIVADIESIATSLLTLQRDARDRLASIDKQAGELVHGVAALHGPLESLDQRVAEVQQIEQAVTVRMDAVQADLNKRMLAVEEEVRAIRSPIEQMARDLQAVVRLLPEPGDGPLSRLKDTFTAS